MHPGLLEGLEVGSVGQRRDFLARQTTLSGFQYELLDSSLTFGISVHLYGKEGLGGGGGEYNLPFKGARGCFSNIVFKCPLDYLVVCALFLSWLVPPSGL